MRARSLTNSLDNLIASLTLLDQYFFIVMKTSKYLHRISALALVGCLIAICNANAIGETRSENNNMSVADDTQAGAQRSVPFITLRDKTGNNKASKFFGGERNILRAGYCEMSHLSLSSLKPVADIAPFYIPEEIVKLDKIRLSPVEDFWPGMQVSLNGQSPVLYAHGFSVGFERGCRRASLLQESLGLNGRLVLFSWPSDGVIVNYTRDESDLFWGVEPLYRTLLEMIDVFGAGKINLAAHSLGTRGIMLALVRLAQSKEGDQPLVNQVVLAAPDIDAAIFEQYLPVIRPLARNITVYVSNKDSALAVSRQLHGYPRLGEAGAHLEGMTSIDIIDMSDIPVRYPSGHVYHLYHNSAVADLSALLKDGKPASQRSNLKQIGENIWSLQSPSTDDRKSRR